ncbi:toll/interleukin-1 receptor domain-containing protein [Pararhizobium sp. LjRoot235]
MALKLASIFGQDQVFYDSWSIRPGDGIIDRMDKGLEAPEFVFFFVSKNSLASGMVRLEWQNALYSASKGKTRIIPVRVDGSEMPAVLKQTLFIDMHTVGLDAAIAQIVSVTQGNVSYTPQHRGFSNLTYSTAVAADGAVDITIRASHLLEPNPRFALVVTNVESEIGWTAPGYSGFVGGFNVGVATRPDGTTANAVVMQPMNAVLTPDHSVRLQLTSKGAATVNLVDVFHQKTETDWVPVPPAR